MQITHARVLEKPGAVSTRVVYRLSHKVHPAGSPDLASEFVSVSWGREGDTGIFVSDSEGRVTSFDALWTADRQLVEHDEAVEMMLSRSASGLFAASAWVVLT